MGNSEIRADPSGEEARDPRTPTAKRYSEEGGVVVVNWLHKGRVIGIYSSASTASWALLGTNIEEGEGRGERKEHSFGVKGSQRKKNKSGECYGHRGLRRSRSSTIPKLIGFPDTKVAGLSEATAKSITETR